MIDRVKGRGAADETPIGLVPDRVVARLGRPRPLGGRAAAAAATSTAREWAAEVPEIRAFFERFGDRLPPELSRSLATLEQDLSRVAV